ncbi:zinc metallopeptidase [Clostridium pasteurianum]|uniref:Putative Zn-dependent protease n=1 Tax=Clostridium pasteurianum BC1 TaxID=86416 RepID=R4K9V3_CLOPA|nr:zinc metallopeptidase [Clostridium pasteurianum]AGK97314.1 putative Zn-dependent protease [Clostridium pasteurianum BC1]
MFFDRTFILLIPAIIISIWAQAKVSSTFEKYTRIRNRNGYTGSEVARMILDAAGLRDIPIEIIPGKLTDHYDPSNRVMRLSPEVFHGDSVSAIGVAAHESGHAIQHKEHYAPLEIRNSIVPVVNFSSGVSWIIFFLGMIFSIPILARVGVILFAAVVVFQLITLPVEFNASNRAVNILESRAILMGEEVKGAKEVLSAAAMTYVAAALMAVLNLIRLIAISRRD